jgi:RNA methyltransferase, TrmH family
MLSAARIKFIRSLSTRKIRAAERLFTVEGVKPVAELLASGYKVHSIYALPQWIAQNKTLLAKSKTEVNPVTDTELERITQLSTPNQVLALVFMPTNQLSINTLKDKLVLALDNLADPGNLGTIIRVADWFGIDTIICSENTVEQYNPKTVQATMGSLFRLNMQYVSLENFIERYKTAYPTHPIAAAVLGGEDLYAQALQTPCLLVMGSESHGISPAVVDMCTHKLTIPAYGASGAESLNVAVSTAIICAELRRQNK